MTTAQNAKPKRMTVQALIDETHHWHGEVIDSMRTAITAAKHAGDALHILKRREGKHGAWMKWVEQNLKPSYDTVVRYMRISTHWEKLKHRVNEPGFTLEKAIQIIIVKQKKAKPDPKPADIDREMLKATFANHLDEWSDDDVHWLSQETDNGINRLDDLMQRLRADRGGAA